MYRASTARPLHIAVSACDMMVSLASLCLAMHHGRVMEEMAEADARMVTATSAGPGFAVGPVRLG